MDEIFTYAGQALIYVASAIVLVSAILVIKDKVKRCSARKDSEDLIKYIKPMMDYMRIKGIDDFVFDCKRWIKRGGITVEARAMLIERYNALTALGANGEREAAFKAMLNLKDIDE